MDVPNDSIKMVRLLQLNSLKENFPGIDAEFINSIFMSVEYDYPSTRQIIEESLKEQNGEQQQNEPQMDDVPTQTPICSKNNESLPLLCQYSDNEDSEDEVLFPYNNLFVNTKMK
jgi:hypothetical protein